MSIPRLLVLSLLTSVFVVPVVAQSLPDNNSIQLQSSTTLPQNGQESIRVDRLRLPFTPDNASLPYAAPDTIQLGEHGDAILPPRQVHKRVLAQNDVTCLAIRSYRVTRDDPDSDSTRLVGYTTCQPSTRFQVKEAVESQKIVLR
jgi:hypothetical protein